MEEALAWVSLIPTGASVTAFNPQQLAKWKRWIARPDDPQLHAPSSIRGEMVRLAHDRAMYERTLEIAAAVPEMPPSALFDYLAYTYLITQAVGLRRQLDSGSDVQTVGRVLREMETSLETLGGAASAPECRTVDLAEVRSIRADLSAKADRVQTFVNKRIAHLDTQDLDPKRADAVLTAGAVHEAVDSLLAAFQFCETTLASTHTTLDLAPFVQHDWEAVFRMAWLPAPPIPVRY